MNEILHKHHYWPRHMGGPDEDWNISYPISLEDHIIWHRVLARMFPEYSHGNLRAATYLEGMPNNGGENCYWFGKKNPQFQKMARERATGSHWYNDGKTSKQFQPDAVPEGWTRGRLSYQGDKNPLSDPDKRHKLTTEDARKGARAVANRRIKCDCGCNKTYNPGNLAKHKKYLERKNATTNTLPTIHSCL